MNEVLNNNRDEKKIATILSYPMNQVRFWASGQFGDKKFNPDTFERLVEKVRPLAADSAVFESELENVRAALSTGEAPRTPNLSSPQTQLLWGGALATIANTPSLMKGWPAEKISKNMTDMPLWSQVAHCPDARSELRENAFILATALKNPQTKMRWGAPDGGYPDVSYYFNHDKNLINLDLVWSLMIGMEHSRAANLHEIGHSQGTLRFSKGVDGAYAEMIALYEKAKDKSRPKDERKRFKKEMQGKQIDYRMRYLIFDEAENNYANRYAVNQSQRSAQDFGVAVNTLETTLCLPLMGKMTPDGKTAPAKQGEPSAMERFSNIKSILRYSFYVNNGMADDTDEGWASIGIRKDWLAGVDKDGNPVDAETSFKELRRMCTELEALQPTSRDRLGGQSHFNKKMEECSDKRCELIDEIYERFVSPLIPELIRDQEKQMEEQKKQRQQQQQQQGEEGEEQDQQQQGGGGQGGQGGEGEEQDQQQQSGNGQSGGGSAGGSSSAGGGSDGLEDLDDDEDGDPSQTDIQKQIDEMERQMSEAVKKMKEDKENQDGGKGGDGKDGSEDGKDGGNSDGKDGEDGKDGSQDGKDKQDGSSGKGGKDGKEDSNKDQGESLEDLVNKPNNSQNTQSKGEAGQQTKENNKGERQEDWKGQPLSGGGKPTINDFMPSRLREANEYNAIVNRHQQTTKRVKNLLQRLQNEYFGKEVESRRRTLVPEDTDLGKFDLESYIERRKKLATGQQIDERDFEHFKVKGDKEKLPAPIDIAILIDRSGSMGKGKGSKLDTALSTACVLYEAARKNPYFNVYITAMGEPTALSVAEPGQSETEIAKKIMTVQDICGGCQDHMQDAILSTMERIKGNKKQEYSGTTHFFVVSDGNFGDEAQSVPLVKQICENAKNMTFNFILTEKNKNRIEALSDEMAKGFGAQRIDRVHISGETGIDAALTSMLNRRMVEMKKIPAQRNTQKSAQMGKLLDTLNAQRKDRR